jgi:CRP-like cAMP-binding protein
MTQYPDPRQEKDETGYTKLQSRNVFYKGKKIFEQGDEGTKAYFIEVGRVEVSITEGGHKVVVSELGPGEIFGEMSLLANEPRTATVTALDDTTVTIISKSKFEQRLAMLEDPVIKTLITVLIERLKSSNQSQVKHYSELMDFQGRVMGIARQLESGIDEKRGNEFREEVEPLLDELEFLLKKYSIPLRKR